MRELDTADVSTSTAAPLSQQLPAAPPPLHPRQSAQFDNTITTATTTTSSKIPPFESPAPPVETGSLDLVMVSGAAEIPLDPAVAIDPGPPANDPVGPGNLCTASSIINHLRHPEERLRLFFKITELFSGTNYVTANIYFPQICEIKANMRKWSNSSNEIIRNMTEAMTLKFDKYWTDIQGLMGIATLLDPRYKHDMLNTCFAMLHGVFEDESEMYVREVIDLLTKLLEEYHVDEDTPETSKSVEEVPAELMSMFSARVAKIRPATRRFFSELDKYLEDDYVPLDTKKFNVLDWWKVAGTRYPTLRLIAHDWIRNRYRDDDNGQEASFWSVLEDIEEGLEGLKL
ncbi:hypothetical protein ACQ4PT_066132 [Festuca glaucescens]